MRSGTKLSLFLFLVALAGGSGCSSSQPSSEDSSIDIESAESGADSVGSIPEDMLAQEESAEAPEGSTATDATTESTENAGGDPFADLSADGASSDGALAVTEEGSTPAASGATETYTVKAGDTLMKIAFSIYGDIDRWKDLRDWNSGVVKKNSQLKVGTQLTYEAPLTPFQPEQLGHSYVIKQGDTLAGIADEVYGRKMKYKKLQKYNDSLIKNANRIFAGFTIFYDITAKEMAEAEARRKERMAGGGSAAPTGMNSLPSTVISPLSPPVSSVGGSASISVAPAAPAPAGSAPSSVVPPPGGVVIPPPSAVVPAPASTN